MIYLKIEILPIDLSLSVKWKIARNESTVKNNFLVQIFEDDKCGRSEIAFNIRYGESAKLVREQFNIFQESLSKIDGKGFLDLLEKSILCNSLRFSLESAYFDLQSKLTGKSIENLLGISDFADRSVPTSFSIPIMDPADAIKFIKERNLGRFSELKLKVSGGADLDLSRAVLDHFPGKIRIDGNEGFQSANEVMRLVEKLGKERISFLEQPLSSKNISEIKILKKDCPVVLIADESVEDGDLSLSLKEGFDGINLKLMKSAGLLQFKKQINQAKAMGLKLMIGCMIESSLGISYALRFCHLVDYIDLDGFLLIDSDPYNLVRENDGLLSFNV